MKIWRLSAVPARLGKERRCSRPSRIDVYVVTAATKPRRTGERIPLSMDADSAVRLDDLALNAIALPAMTGAAHAAVSDGDCRSRKTISPCRLRTWRLASAVSRRCVGSSSEQAHFYSLLDWARTWHGQIHVRPLWSKTMLDYLTRRLPLYKGPSWSYLSFRGEPAMAADTTSLHLRLPKTLYKRLQRQAKRNNVSLNTEVVNQLEGAEAAEAKQRAEAMKPFFEKLIEDTTKKVSRELQIFLAIDGGPRTEAEFEEQLRRMGEPSDRAAKFLQLFRERRASRSGKTRNEPDAEK
jgi:hypothetical protein